MSIAKSVYTFLSGRSPELASTIYETHLPEQHTGFPAITFTVDDDDDIQLLTGGVSTLFVARISIDVWDPLYSNVHTVADAIETATVGYRGSFGDETAAQINKERRFDIPKEPDTGLHRVSMQFLIWYT